MSREKQIEEMACKNCIHYEVCMYVNAQAVEYARAENCKLFRDNAGYRKQSEGEWIPIIDEPTPLRECAIISGYECSECGRYEKEKQPYCNCGAKMKGE